MTTRGQNILLGVVCAAALGGCVAAHPGSPSLPWQLLFFRLWRLASSRFSCGSSAAGPGSPGAPTAGAVLAAVLLYWALADFKLLAGVMAYRRAVRAVIPDSVNLALFDLPQFPALRTPSPDDFNLVVGLLAIVGAIIAVFVREARPLAVSWLAFVVLYVLAAGPENGLRWLTGFWYKDTQRIAPFIAMAGSILAALTIVVITGTVIRAVSARWPDAAVSGRWKVPAALFTGCVMVITGAIYFSSAAYRSVDRVAVAAQNYAVSAKPGDGVLSSGEQAFIQRAGALLPADAVVIGIPSTAKRISMRSREGTSSTPSWALRRLRAQPKSCFAPASTACTLTSQSAPPCSRWGRRTSTRTLRAARTGAPA